MALSTMSTERKRCSLIAPFLRLRIRAWTRPRRLPGVLCWASTTRYSSFSCLMHIPRFNWVAWIMDASSSLSANLHYSSLDLQAPQVDPEWHGLEPRGVHRGLHRLAPAWRRPDRDHPAASRPADLGRSARGSGGGG